MRPPRPQQASHHFLRRWPREKRADRGPREIVKVVEVGASHEELENSHTHPSKYLIQKLVSEIRAQKRRRWARRHQDPLLSPLTPPAKAGILPGVPILPREIADLKSKEEPMPTMRAKMQIQAVSPAYGGAELIHAYPVCSNMNESGDSEDNTYSKFTPSGKLELLINNPDLIGKLKPGQKFYVDFTEAPE